MALGGRVLPGSPDPAKYKNSAETAIYSKRRTLYALNWAKQGVVATGEVVVCEGYTDVIGFFEAGVERAVATCGTALAEDHVRLLRNFANRVVLAFDADAAGQSAAARFYEWERRYEIDVAVAALPAGADPADLAGRDPAALRAAVEGAKPYLQFRVERSSMQPTVTGPEGRAKAAARSLEVVAEHPDDLVRDQYLMQIAERCHLDPDQLRLAAQRVAGRGRRTGPTPAGGRSDANVDQDGRNGAHEAPIRGSARRGWRRCSRPWPPEFRPGLEALRLAIHRPEDVQDRLEAVLFGDDRQRAAFVALASSDTLREAVEGAPPEVSDLLVRLTVEEPLEQADDVVRHLVWVAGRRELSGLEAEARTLPEANEECQECGGLAARARRPRLLGRGDAEVGSLASGAIRGDR